MTIDLEEALRRGIRNAGRGRRRGVHWGHVAEVFLVGSTSAFELCGWAGVDPEAQTGRDTDCAEGCDCECHHD